MPVIDGIKFSCAACVKGHRSANCPHGDRPLIEIAKKGRPSTQCDRCRELRRTKQLHSKCVCLRPCTCGNPGPACICNPPQPVTTDVKPPKRRVSSANSRKPQGPHDTEHGHVASHRNLYDPYAVPGKLPVSQLPDRKRALHFPSAFAPQVPSKEPVASLCFCGPDCDCPGCPDHSGPSIVDQFYGRGVTAPASVTPQQCGLSCNSFGLCSASGDVKLPAGITNMEQMLSAMQPRAPPAAPSAAPSHANGHFQQLNAGLNESFATTFEEQLFTLQNWPSRSNLQGHQQYRSAESDPYASDYSSYASSAVSSVIDGHDGTEEVLSNVDTTGAGFPGGVLDITRWRNELPEPNEPLSTYGNVLPPLASTSYLPQEAYPDSFMLQSQSQYPTHATAFPPLPSPASTFYERSDYGHSTSQLSLHSLSQHLSNSQLPPAPYALFRSSSVASSTSLHGSNHSQNPLDFEDPYPEFTSPPSHVSDVSGDESRFDNINLNGYSNLPTDLYPQFYTNGQTQNLEAPFSASPSSYGPPTFYVPPLSSNSSSSSHRLSNSLLENSPPRLPRNTGSNPALSLDRFETQRPSELARQGSSSSISKSKINFGFNSTSDNGNGNGHGNGGGKGLSLERTKTERPTNIAGNIKKGGGSGDSGGSGSGSQSPAGMRGIGALFQKVKDKF